jgi:hypothetical protein
MNEEALAHFIQGARALLSERGAATLAAEFEEHVKYCRGRNYNQEGIPMLLVLEDVSGSASPPLSSGDPLYNLSLVAATELFREQLQQEGRDLRPEDIFSILEVVAERYFGFLSSHPEHY